MATAQVTIKITGAMLRGAQRRGMSMEAYLAEAADAVEAGAEAEKLAAAAKLAPVGTVNGNGNDFRFLEKRKLSPERIQRILFLYLNVGLQAPAIAERLSISESTIYRIISQFVRRPEHNWPASNRDRISQAKSQIAHQEG